MSLVGRPRSAVCLRLAAAARRRDLHAISAIAFVQAASPPARPICRSASTIPLIHSPAIASRLRLRPYSTTHRPDLHHRAFVALGSNVGDRLQFIEDACAALDAHHDLHVVRTSSLWETKAMYVTDQDDFLNGVCEVRTSLDPIPLLDRLQLVEKNLRRRKTIDKGPRTIDLDILLYDDIKYEDDRLIVPHRLMLERAFVLQPLCQLIPDETAASSDGQKLSFSEHLERLDPASLATSTLTPLGNGSLALRALSHDRSTRLMSVLNVTPDSFSDGGENSADDMEQLERTVRAHIEAGASVVDVGGQSTRPRADDVGTEEELRRVLPAIKLVRSIVGSRKDVAISVDTYRARVAEAAVEAGADVVNDVSAGTLDADMLPTVARLGCTYVLMHMRGDPSTMSNTENTDYPQGLVATIAAELGERVRLAEEAGIRRWRLVVDPGIGFAKNGTQNLELLQRLSELRGPARLKGLPWAVGTSRKRFIGQVTGVQTARERVWGTAACVTAAIQGGADVVRVHDVREMGQVASMADAIWRRRAGS